MIPTPTQDGAQGFVPHPGGAVFNTAIGLGRLGIEVGLISGVSNDLFGDQLRAALTQSHVSTDHLILSDRPTTLAFVQLLDGHASYRFYDENSAGRIISTDDLSPLSDDVRALYFGGISLACEPCADTYLALMQYAGDAPLIMVDPNIRPGFITDQARYRARLDQVFERADIIKVSDEDLDWILPGDAPLEAKSQSLLAHGAALVIVTQGADGATGFLPNGETRHAAVPKVQVADTVGAGDTFNAGVLARLSQLDLLSRDALRSATPETILSALTHGSKVAAVTVSRPGANPPWANELV
jgi:fructokinase